MNITVYVYRPGSGDPETLEIAKELLVEDLLQRICNGRHEEVDLFSEGLAEPHGRKASVAETGITDGNHLYCRPRPHEVRVHIDERAHHSPSVTTGDALYRLGAVPEGHQLYREVEGNRESEPIFRDQEVLELKEDEHFHSSDKPFKGYDIFVNTQPKVVHKRRLTFYEIVDLAFNPRPTGTDLKFTVLFRNAAGRPHMGTLSEKHAVKVKNGTIFDVTSTFRS